MGHRPQHVTFSIHLFVHPPVRLSIRLSVAHHPIITFGSRVYNEISRRFFSFFLNFDFLGWHFISQEPYIICCRLFYLQDKMMIKHKWWYLLVFSFFKILIFKFQVVSGIKGRNVAQNDKMCTSYDCGFWYTWKLASGT